MHENNDHLLAGAWWVTSKSLDFSRLLFCYALLLRKAKMHAKNMRNGTALNLYPLAAHESYSAVVEPVTVREQEENFVRIFFAR